MVDKNSPKGGVVLSEGPQEGLQEGPGGSYQVIQGITGKTTQVLNGEGSSGGQESNTILSQEPEYETFQYIGMNGNMIRITPERLTTFLHTMQKSAGALFQDAEEAKNFIQTHLGSLNIFIPCTQKSPDQEQKMQDTRRGAVISNDACIDQSAGSGDIRDAYAAFNASTNKQ